MKKQAASVKSNFVFKLTLVLVALFVMFSLLLSVKQSSSEATILASNYVIYDMAKSILGDSELDVELLIKPGVDIHHFEPSPQDFTKISHAKLFVYIGGESDSWLGKDIVNPERGLKLLETPGLKLLEDEHGDIDEHIWFSLENYSLMSKQLCEKISALDPEYEEKYRENAQKLESEISELRNDLQQLAKTQKQPIIFADGFPAKYLFDEFGLEYYSAISGCGEDADVSPATIAKIVNKIKAENIGYIFKLESTSDVANTISAETGAKILTFQSMQYVDEQRGYLDFMQENIANLQMAAQ